MSNENTYRDATYEFVIKDYLDIPRQQWFEGLTVTTKGQGFTVLTGPIRDQAALYGVLKKVHNLGLTLVSVNALPHTKKQGN